MLVCALDCYPVLQKPLNWNVSRYLGDISFGVYVMHYMMEGALWVHVLDPLRVSLVGWNGWGSIPFFVAMYVAVLWAADLFIKIDDRVVNFARLIEKKVFV